MKSILEQLKSRRQALGLKQSDMMLRVGFSRQQYQRLEASGNPRLATLDLLAKGLNAELMLIPKEKLVAVLAILESSDTSSTNTPTQDRQKSLAEDPWQDLLDDDE